MSIKNKVIAIYGPTISEKTGLAINVARYIWGKYQIEPELISADSKKVYKELSIGPASIFPRYAGKIKVHMFRFIDSLEKPFTLYDYKSQVDKIIAEAHVKNHLPIIFGGGAVYVSAVLENWIVPEKWEKGVDYKSTLGKGPKNYDYIILIPNISKTALYRKIDEYSRRSIKLGILEELQRLVEKYHIDPLVPNDHVLYQSLEYRQFLEYCFQKQKKLSDLTTQDIESIRKESVRDLKAFARRQLTWIPKMEGEKYLVSSWKEAREKVDKFLFRD